MKTLFKIIELILRIAGFFRRLFGRPIAKPVEREEYVTSSTGCAMESKECAGDLMIVGVTRSKAGTPSWAQILCYKNGIEVGHDINSKLTPVSGGQLCLYPYDGSVESRNIYNGFNAA